MFIQLLSRLHRYAARRMLPALMLFALMLPGLAAAQSLTGAVHVMSANGLNLKADVRWLEGNGYRPIQIEVLPIVPAAADRTLTVEFHARDMYGGGSLRVGQDIEIPAGATRVVETLTVPNGAWNTYSLEVYDNGVYRKGLSVQAAPGNWGGRGWEEGLPNILVVRDQVPDSGQFTMLFPAASMIQNYGNASTINGQIQMPTIAALPAARLPDKWIDYTSLDILCLPLATLQQLAVAEPETLTAIVRWTTSGGNLWVSGVGNDFASLAEIERIIGLFPSVPTALAGPRPGWEWPAAARYGQPLDIVQTDNYAYNQAVEATMPGEMPATEAAIVPPTAPAPQFASRELGRGLVMALAPEDPFPGETQQWQWLFNHVGAQRYLWYKRLGQSNKRSNPDFWNWLILGVGLAPVTAFRVLITLFVLAIGPLNFYLLWKAGRLQLLLVVVPAFSLLVTGSLFAYAILSDGLGTRARVRSFTQIDQQKSEAVCSSRVTYYAGLAPYDGLRFSDDVAIFPLMPLGVSQSRQHAVLETDWTAEGQHLTGGWLASRAPTQYQMLRSRRSPHQLQIVPQPEGPPRAINRLGTRLLQLMVVDEGGALYRAVDLAAGGETVLQPGDKTADRATMVAALARLAPALTPGIDPADYEQWGTYRNYGWMYNNSGQDDASQSTGLLERGFAGVMTLNMDSLAPRQYIALAERSPEVELGTEVTHEDGSVHLIRGTW